mmetsp:Transcript_4814/g.13921  ORF Transcript_4814/g.13921 Transcript_4814/m.13921 type:complete len:262 (+) Transcript_4814:2039-2824(+)
MVVPEMVVPGGRIRKVHDGHEAESVVSVHVFHDVLPLAIRSVGKARPSVRRRALAPWMLGLAGVDGSFRSVPVDFPVVVDPAVAFPSKVQRHEFVFDSVFVRQWFGVSQDHAPRVVLRGIHPERHLVGSLHPDNGQGRFVFDGPVLVPIPCRQTGREPAVLPDLEFLAVGAERIEGFCKIRSVIVFVKDAVVVHDRVGETIGIVLRFPLGVRVAERGGEILFVDEIPFLLAGDELGVSSTGDKKRRRKRMPIGLHCEKISY